ncbi:MAG TPA: Amuc_1100 family pilus-like protein [Chthoniobacterales bacterium]
MNWFNQNRWLGTFLIVFGVVSLAALYFLFSARGRSNEAVARFQEAVTEKNRLERLDPFPTESNVRKMKLHLENYTTALEKLKEDLKGRVPNPAPLAPNEFQARLRQSMLAIAERARTNRVKLPDGFALGFDEYTSALPATNAAPLLGQELTQIEALLNLIIDSRVDGIASFVRKPTPDEHGAAASPSPSPAARPAASATSQSSQVVDRGVVDVTFTCAPSSGRRVLNQIVSSPQQLYVVRVLNIRNEKEKGPPREQAQTAQTAAAAPPTPAKPAATGALNFIVGNEHIEVSSRIELLRFKF